MQTRKAKWTANSMIGALQLLHTLHFLNNIGFPHTAGAGGGLVASIATCPLDVIKTKLQAQRTVQGQQGYQGVLGMFSGPFISVLISLIIPDTPLQTSLKQPSNMMEYAACIVVLAPQSWGIFQQWLSTLRYMTGLRRASENLRWAKCRNMTEYTLLHKLRATSP